MAAASAALRTAVHCLAVAWLVSISTSAMAARPRNPVCVRVAIEGIPSLVCGQQRGRSK